MPRQWQKQGRSLPDSASSCRQLLSALRPTSKSTAPARRGSRPATKSVCTSSTLCTCRTAIAHARQVKQLQEGWHLALHALLARAACECVGCRASVTLYTCSTVSQWLLLQAGLTPCACSVAAVACSAAGLMSVATKLQPVAVQEGPCRCPMLPAVAAGRGEPVACLVCCRASATEQMTYPLPHPTSRHLRTCEVGSEAAEKESLAVAVQVVLACTATLTFGLAAWHVVVPASALAPAASMPALHPPAQSCPAFGRVCSSGPAAAASEALGSNNNISATKKDMSAALAHSRAVGCVFLPLLPRCCCCQTHI